MISRQVVLQLIEALPNEARSFRIGQQGVGAGSPRGQLDLFTSRPRRRARNGRSYRRVSRRDFSRENPSPCSRRCGATRFETNSFPEMSRGCAPRRGMSPDKSLLCLHGRNRLITGIRSAPQRDNIYRTTHPRRRRHRSRQRSINSASTFPGSETGTR